MQKNYARNDIFLPRTDVQEADIQEDNKQTDRQKTGGHTTENAPTNNNAESKHVASGITVTPCYGAIYYQKRIISGSGYPSYPKRSSTPRQSGSLPPSL